MLVLTRKLQERIQIGDNITITILRVKGRQVRVGIEAPRDVRVLRTELPSSDSANEEVEVSDSQPVAETESAGADAALADDQSQLSEKPADSRRSLVIGRRFRIVTPKNGAKGHSPAAVAIG